MTETIGQRLRKLRLAKGKSQRRLAADIGISYPHVSKLEAGIHTPSPETLQNVAKVCGADYDELVILTRSLPEWAMDAIVEDPLAAIDALRTFAARPR